MGRRPGPRAAGGPAGGLPVCGPALVRVKSRARNEARSAATARWNRLGGRPPGRDGPGANPAVLVLAERCARRRHGAAGGCLAWAEVTTDHLRGLPAGSGVFGLPAVAPVTGALRGTVPDGRFHSRPGSWLTVRFGFRPVSAPPPGRRCPARLRILRRALAGARRRIRRAPAGPGIVPFASGALPVTAGALTRVGRPPVTAALLARHSRPPVPGRLARRPRPPVTGCPGGRSRPGRPSRVARRGRPAVTGRRTRTGGTPVTKGLIRGNRTGVASHLTWPGRAPGRASRVAHGLASVVTATCLASRTGPPAPGR